MNKPFVPFALTPASRGIARAVLCVFTLATISTVQPAYAEVADLADVPLTTSSTSVVKPNIMFILDDSGSMAFDHTPDYVNDPDPNASTAQASCYDGGNDNDGGGTGTITGTVVDACRMGDPPYTSPDFNTQYYNPEFTYTPPVNADGTSKPSIGSPWTAVPTDGFNVQNTDQLDFTNDRNNPNNGSVVSKNLVTGYPDRLWCTTAGGSTCVKNADYTYPDTAFPFGKSTTGAPYYYRIVPNEHCTTADLTVCIASVVPTATHPFPAKTRWCNSTALANCQARRLGSFIIPKHVGRVITGPAAAKAATGTVTINNSGSDVSTALTSLTVNGVNIISSTVTAAGGTNTPTERQAAAQALCNAINSFASTPDYQARNTGSGTTCSSTGSETVTVEAMVTGPTPNGFVVTPGSTAAGTIAASARVFISAASSGSQITGGATINGVAITDGATLTASGSGSNARRTSLRNQLETAITSFTSSPEYTATRVGNFTLDIFATAAEGASANGRLVVIPAVSGATLTITDCTAPSATDAMCGGVTSGFPATATNMTGGADAITATGTVRVDVGTWARTDIVPTTTSYPRATTRSDCAGATCTYTEEMTNFANWYAYYRTRMQMMKSSAGRSFVSLGDSYRVGFVSINPGDNPSGQSPSGFEFVPVNDFTAGTGGHKATWYTRFYGMSPNSGTPLREALSRVGRYYANVTTGINASMTDDPVQYSCQQNIALLTTDGFWAFDSFGGQDLGGGSIGNQDNADSGFSTRAVGAFDGGLGGTASDSSTGSANTLADTALYFYKTDLRPTGGVSTNNVPSSGKDNAPHQHMTTFTLGLGLDGVMNYRPDYETATTGDFANIVSSTANDCAWAPGVKCDWPQVRGNTPTALDDLWHAAVNGRGTYFSARDPNALFTGLTNALASVAIRTGAAAASATSSPNVTPTDRAIYSSTYRTQIWDGEIVAQLIDTATGAVLPEVTWSAQALLDGKVLASSDSRVIKVFDAAEPNKLKEFTYATLNTAERAYFTDRVCVTTSPVASPAEPLAQCTLGMMDANKVAANDAQNLIPYLRGQTGKESILYRAREHTLGDTVNATPAYVRLPTNTFTDADYSAFKTAQTSADRAAALYVAANDGMLHAFNGLTGEETWAFIPKAIFPVLYKLAATDYATTHRYFVDGSPVAMDVYDNVTVPTTPVWKTILVGGLGGGGRGFYALDVTDPAVPKALWEFCTDAALCNVTDPDLGFALGNPVITKRKIGTVEKWVVLVTSGYNNVPDATDLFPETGDGKGYLYVLDAITGAVLQKIDTGVGSTTTPAGLAKIAAYAEDFTTNNTTRFVYGGDLLGNVWRFDLTVSPATVMRIATLKDGSSPARPQSITTRPELASINGIPVLFIGTGRYLGANDLPDGSTLSPALPYAYQNSLYAFKDLQVDLGDLRTRSDIQSRTLTVETATTRSTSNTPVMDWTANSGWRLDFNPGTSPGDSPGERLNIDPQLILGTLILATNVPANTACSVGGESWLYQLNYLEGTYVSTSPGNVAATKSSNATVGFVVVKLPDGSVKIIKTDSIGNKSTEGANIGSGAAGGRRVSWRELAN